MNIVSKELTITYQDFIVIQEAVDTLQRSYNGPRVHRFMLPLSPRVVTAPNDEAVCDKEVAVYCEVYYDMYNDIKITIRKHDIKEK